MTSNIENNKLLNVRQTISIISFFVISTFAVTTIYNEFRLMQKEIDHLKEAIEYEKSRVDRKYSRVDERIKELEKPHSDDD